MGGAEEYTLRLAGEARKRGWNVSAALALDSSVDDLEHLLVNVGARVFRKIHYAANPASRMEILRQLGAMVPGLISTRTDVLHIVLPWPTFGWAVIRGLSFFSIPTFLSFQLAASGIEMPEEVAAKYRAIRKKHKEWIAISYENRKLLSRLFGIREQEISVIYNGTDFVEVSGTDTTHHRRTLRERLKVAHDVRIVATVARVDSVQKGYRYLVEAAEDVIRKSKDVRFLWVGDGPDIVDLRQQIDHKGLSRHFFLDGHRNDIADILRGSDVFALPTLFEGGSSFALLEAMAVGLPCVATAVSGIPEVLRDGLDGILVAPRDSGALGRALESILTNPELAHRLGDSARERAKLFSERAMLDQTFALYEKHLTARMR